MKQVTLFFCTALLLVACADQEKETTNDSGAVVKSAAATEPAPDSATMMKNWTAYMQPGKEHQLMASWNGTWDTEITSWAAPGAPPSKITGTVENQMLLDGRYQQSLHQASWEGAPFQGISTMGYDNAKKIFVSTWIDNMGTGIMSAEGPWDEATQSITFTGRMVDPSRLKEVGIREIFKVIDSNTQVMEMFAPSPDGKEFKSMEIRFTRKK